MKQDIIDQSVYTQFKNDCYPHNHFDFLGKSGISQKSTSSQNQDDHQCYQNFTRMSHQYFCENQYTFEANPQNSKYKIQLCRNYMNYGCCPYGERCQYAHGLEQLRYTNGMPCIQVQINPQVLTTNQKYKTKQCRQFFKRGYCPYGETCNYLHKDLIIKGQKQTKKEEKKLKVMDDGFRQIIFQSRPQSRILKLFKKNK